jgi:hypothetical protein
MKPTIPFHESLWIIGKEPMPRGIGILPMAFQFFRRGGRMHSMLVKIGILWCLSMAAGISAPDSQKDSPTVEVINIGWSQDRQLVLGVRITAPTSRPLPLGQDTQNPDESVTLFTTKESWLIDLRSGQKIPASRKYPNQPNFGWIKTVETLSPGDSATFTAAFPTPPLPPMTGGKREDYHLQLHLPGNLPPVDFQVPVPQEPAP